MRIIIFLAAITIWILDRFWDIVYLHKVKNWVIMNEFKPLLVQGFTLKVVSDLNDELLRPMNHLIYHWFACVGIRVVFVIVEGVIHTVVFAPHPIFEYL